MLRIEKSRVCDQANGLNGIESCSSTRNGDLQRIEYFADTPEHVWIVHFKRNTSRLKLLPIASLKICMLISLIFFYSLGIIIIFFYYFFLQSELRIGSFNFTSPTKVRITNTLIFGNEITQVFFFH